MLREPQRLGVADCPHGGLIGCRHCLWLLAEARRAYLASRKIRQHWDAGRSAAHRAEVDARHALAELRAWRADGADRAL